MGELEGKRGASSSENRERIFSRLRPYCIELLELTRNPRKNSSFLTEMADFLRRAPAAGLQPCLDYTLFPLLLLLDAAVQCRSGKKANSIGGGGQVISDSVAEGTLRCLEGLLTKCHLGSVNQMVMMLKKLTSGALLSPSEASEEFREGIIKCLKAMLLRLQPCSFGSCSCKEIFIFPMLVATLEHCLPKSSYYEEPEECLLSFLQSKDASAAVGHWLSLLLQAAEEEAARGHRGSATLRKEAFLTLRVLVAKVGTADALGFFLPGMVSRFTKSLLVTKNMISGAAGNAGSIEHAVLGLSEFLIVVLRDDVNLIGLQMSTSEITFNYQNKNGSTQTVLDAIRQLPASLHYQSEDSMSQSIQTPKKDESKVKNPDTFSGARSLYVQRTKDWVDQTSTHVDKLLSATFPHLCVHPAEKVRKALVDGTMGLLSNCTLTLRRSRLMLLECLCVLVCDDSHVVSSAAEDSLNSLFISGKKILSEIDFSELFTSLLERLPKMVLRSEEVAALSHARRLLALMYYAGPELVVDHIFCSPMKAARFLDFFMLSFGHNSQFGGSIDKLISSKPLSVGYLLSVAELKASSLSRDASYVINGDVLPLVSELSMGSLSENMPIEYEFPRMPPWFLNVGNQKLYLALAGILRLAGLSVMAVNRSDISLLGLIDNLLEHVRKLISEVRMKGYNKEGWQSWYSQCSSGQLLRQTSTAVCVLNEIIYGLADHSVSTCLKLFKTEKNIEESLRKEFVCDRDLISTSRRLSWKVHQGKDAREHIIHCVGSILHEYTSSEVWELPIDPTSSQLEHDSETNLSLYIFRDSRMLHQVIIEGIGIFSKVIGKDFISSGFMHSTLYLLLKNLICSNDLIRSASDAALHVLSANTGYSTVGHLVVANADYIIDSLCRQLRHLDLNPHVPNVLAAMLSYVGAADEILPLLEEPMRAVSLELEVLGRHQHPHLTVPFLKAVNEISKASRFESCRLPSVAESFNAHVMVNVSSAQDMVENTSMAMPENGNFMGIQLQLEHLEELLFKLNDMRRYRRTIGSLASSCLKAATPLVSSQEESTCLAALNILEDTTMCLAKVEEAYRHEQKSKSAIGRAIQLCSFNELEDEIDAEDEDVDENRLLPAMNKIWPYLILCLKNRISVAVIRRCAGVLTKTVQIAGGDFFARRFHTDGPVIWKLLNSSPFQRRPLPSKNSQPLLPPYRNSSLTSEYPMAETSSMKIQSAILNMIAEIASNKRSAPALQTVFNKVAGLVVGIACSNVPGLRDESIKALSGLASINPDPIWLLMADVYYSLIDKDMPQPPSPDLANIRQLLPPPLSSKEYLYVQYGGETFGFDVDPISVERVFHKLSSEVFN
ncbi:hypothetical protein IEQ34_014711 [Dendrobium chrysotoxum]|uniref:ARM repeat superfamily protein n=1 Tax=Dendrobium chrysotoxum TaxID=161865 RepID=A0AAV7GM73_DENCH|nr:hypothetical protein IEQ34_014711 [Dendrobium chrysotoxum]